MNRNTLIQNLKDYEPRKWDIIVIGGGATGLGVALDAVTRGYKTILLEQSDFAKATSSRSTKLVHGGVRYLAQGDILLVTEALHERGTDAEKCSSPYRKSGICNSCLYLLGCFSCIPLA